MKKVFFVGILIWAVSGGLFAQNRSIQFEESLTWQQIVDKAKTDKKIIFVDCYTSWCEPCKKLSATVFTVDEVADCFNKEFVNAHYDMEKAPEGKMFVAKYGVNTYPTLLFIDPMTENIVHRVAGAGDSKWLLGTARLAQNGLNNLGGMYKRYKSGERGIEFIKNYLKLLSGAQQERISKAVVNDYMKTVPDDIFLTKEMFNLIKQTTETPLDEAYRRVMADLQQAYSIWGQQEVDDLLGKVIRNYVFVVYNWKRIYNSPYDEKWNDELITYLKSLSFPGIPQALVELQTVKCTRSKDFNGALDCMKEAFEMNVFTTGGGRSYFLESMELFTDCKDTVTMEKALAWIDAELRQTDNYFYKSNLSHIKYLLYRSMGQDEAAGKASDDKNKYFDEGSKLCGGRVLRMIKPE